MLRICVLHGPNLNLLGEQREPGIYGSATLEDVNCALKDVASELGVSLSHFQSNHEGELIDKIHALHGECDGIVINPGVLDSNTALHSHTSQCQSALASFPLMQNR